MEYDYGGDWKTQKIPLGIFYQSQRETYEEMWPQLEELKKQGKSWKDIKR